MLVLIGILIYFGLFSSVVLAVPPPDFIFNIGTQLSQIFAVAVIFFSAVFGVIYNYLKVYWNNFAKFKYRRLVIFALILLILGASFGFALWYQHYQQEQAYFEWLKQSKSNIN